MFTNIQAARFFFYGNSQNSDSLQNSEKHEHREKCPGTDYRGPNQLRHKREAFRRTKDTCRQTTPDATEAMYRKCADRIVDPQFVERHDADHNQQARYQTDHNRSQERYLIAIGRDPDQTGQGTVECHGDIGFGEQDPADEHRGHRPGRCGQRGRYGNVGRRSGVTDARISQLASRIESVPADPEDQHAKGRKGDVVARHGDRFSP